MDRQTSRFRVLIIYIVESTILKTREDSPSTNYSEILELKVWQIASFLKALNFDILKMTNIRRSESNTSKMSLIYIISFYCGVELCKIRWTVEVSWHFNPSLIQLFSYHFSQKNARFKGQNQAIGLHKDKGLCTKLFDYLNNQIYILKEFFDLF